VGLRFVGRLGDREGIDALVVTRLNVFG